MSDSEHKYPLIAVKLPRCECHINATAHPAFECQRAAVYLVRIIDNRLSLRCDRCILDGYRIIACLSEFDGDYENLVKPLGGAGATGAGGTI